MINLCIGAVLLLLILLQCQFFVSFRNFTTMWYVCEAGGLLNRAVQCLTTQQISECRYTVHSWMADELLCFAVWFSISVKVKWLSFL